MLQLSIWYWTSLDMEIKEFISRALLVFMPMLFCRRGSSIPFVSEILFMKSLYDEYCVETIFGASFTSTILVIRFPSYHLILHRLKWEIAPNCTYWPLSYSSQLTSPPLAIFIHINIQCITCRLNMEQQCVDDIAGYVSYDLKLLQECLPHKSNISHHIVYCRVAVFSHSITNAHDFCRMFKAVKKLKRSIHRFVLAFFLTIYSQYIHKLITSNEVTNCNERKLLFLSKRASEQGFFF